MIQYLLKLSMNSENLDCVALLAGEPGLGLDEHGITWMCENSPVRIEVAMDELQITANTQSSISLIRNGRTRQIKPSHSLRLLSGDDICLGTHRIHVQSVTKSRSSHFREVFESLRHASRAIMLTSAAALALSACNPIADFIVGERTAGDVEMIEDPVQEPEKTETHPNALPDSVQNADNPEPAVNEIATDIEEHVMGESAKIPCDGKEGQELKSCCEALDIEGMKKECCERLKNDGLQCDDGSEKAAIINENQVTGKLNAPEETVEEKPAVVPQRMHGAIKQTPCAGITDGEKLKACCNGLDNEALKMGCCFHLEEHFNGMKCE